MPSDSTSPSDFSHPAVAYVRAAGEVVLYALVVIAPWPFASVEPPAEYLLAAGVTLLAALWAVHTGLTGRIAIRPDAVAVALGGLVLWTAFQLLPLPEAVVGVLSPSRVSWHNSLLPAQSELLPGEAGSEARSSFLPLTVDRSATTTFLCRLLELFVVYLAARNWLATRESFPRLAWALTANGVALAVFALSQAMSSPQSEMFWSVRVPNGSGPFGPFVCRNHYPDYIGLCLGLCVGLLLPRQRTAGDGPGPKLLTAQGLALTAATAIMVVSIPFSLSRGGVIAALVAGAGSWLLARSVGGRGGPGRWALLAAAAGAALTAAWLGASTVEDRLSTLATTESTTGRIPLWTDSLQLAPGIWGGGTGGGTYVWVEPTVRRDGRPAMYYYENAHNEYLEAWIEGGVVRFVLTLVLAVGPLVAIVRGYRRRHDRSVGPWILGAGFGLAIVIFHAFTDFGVHMPPVALLATVVAGFGLAAAQDVGFIPQRVRVRRTRAGQATVTEVIGPADEAPPVDDPRGTFRGIPATFVGLGIALLALLATLDARSRDRGYRLLLAADEAAAAGRTEDRVAQLDARAATRPNDPEALFAAAQAHIDEAISSTWIPGAGLAGAAAGFTAPPDQIAPAVRDRHIIPALKLLREARRANPLAPKPHTRLGLYAEVFATSEPASVHFARAKSLIPSDPDVWYASGRSAFKHGDPAAAWADWKRSLALSPQNLPAILAAARGKLTPAEIRVKLLPDDPVTILAALDLLFPDRVAQAAERRPFVQSVIDLARTPPRTGTTADRLMALAMALDELGNPDDADDAWDKAVRLAPDRPDVRDRYARWLERDERYDEALVHLEWLRQRNRGNQDVQDRLDAARHAVRLKKDIDG